MPDPGTAPKYLVYGLVDPRTLIVEYTGKSSSGLKRPAQHRMASSLRPNNSKNIWLRELFAAGLDYEIVILDSVEDPKAPGTLCWWWTGKNATALNDLERWWIAYGRSRGCSLKNSTDGGDGASYGDANVSRRPSVRAKLSISSAEYANRPEVVEQSSERMRLLWEDEVYRQEVTERTRERWSDPAHRALVVAAATAYSNTPDALSAFQKRSEKWWQDPEYCADRSEQSRRRWEDPDYRARMLRASIEYNSQPEVTAKSSTRMRQLWEDSAFREATTVMAKEYHNRPEVKAALSSRNRTDNPAWRPGVQAKMRASWTDERRAAQSLRSTERHRKNHEQRQRCGTLSAYRRALKDRKEGLENCGPCALCKRASADYAMERKRKRAQTAA